MSVTLHDISCNHCDRTVWFSNGDETDHTVPDVETVKCPYCGKASWADRSLWSPGSDDDDLDPDLADEGYKTALEALAGEHHT